jgi:hypothetical protein
MSVDFSRIVTSITCAGASRIHDMYATALNILINTTHNVLVLNYNDLEENQVVEDRLKMLVELGKHTNNEVEIQRFDSKVALAAMHASTIELGSSIREFWLSIDDDVLIPYQTLNLLSKASYYNSRDLFLYGFFEVQNFRNYADWNPKPYNLSDVGHIIEEHGEKHILHRLCARIPKFVMLKFFEQDQHCGSFMVRLKKVNEPQLLTKLKHWEKGIRGVDVYICRYVNNPSWIVGSNAFHTDCTRAHVDNVLWKKDVEDKTWGKSNAT